MQIFTDNVYLLIDSVIECCSGFLLANEDETRHCPMQTMKYQTLDNVLQQQSQGTLKEWAIAYLKGEGGNPKLAAHIEARPESTAILLNSPLHHLKRGVDPDNNYKWSESSDVFERRVTTFQNRIRQGILPLPIMMMDFWPDLLVADGNHRLEALRREGRKRYWVIYICQDPKNFQNLIQGKRIVSASS